MLKKYIFIMMIFIVHTHTAFCMERNNSIPIRTLCAAIVVENDYTLPVITRLQSPFLEHTFNTDSGIVNGIISGLTTKNMPGCSVFGSHITIGMNTCTFEHNYENAYTGPLIAEQAIKSTLNIPVLHETNSLSLHDGKVLMSLSAYDNKKLDLNIQINN